MSGQAPRFSEERRHDNPRPEDLGAYLADLQQRLREEVHREVAQAQARRHTQAYQDAQAFQGGPAPAGRQGEEEIPVFLPEPGAFFGAGTYPVPMVAGGRAEGYPSSGIAGVSAAPVGLNAPPAVSPLIMGPMGAALSQNLVMPTFSGRNFPDFATKWGLYMMQVGAGQGVIPEDMKLSLLYQALDEGSKAEFLRRHESGRPLKHAELWSWLTSKFGGDVQGSIRAELQVCDRSTPDGSTGSHGSTSSRSFGFCSNGWKTLPRTKPGRCS